MRPSETFCRNALAMATGSTPGCDQKRRSSAAMVAATSDRRQALRIEVHAARAVARPRLVERHTATVDNDSRRRVAEVEERGVDRPEPQPEGQGEERQETNPDHRAPMAQNGAAEQHKSLHGLCQHLLVLAGPHDAASASLRSRRWLQGLVDLSVYQCWRGPTPARSRAATSRRARAAGAASVSAPSSYLLSPTS